MFRRKRADEIALAESVRHDFEQGIIDRELLTRICNGYKATDSIQEFIQEASECFPYGNQIIASLYIREKVGGTVTEGTFNSEPHAFLMLKDKRIIDITADQYGGPKVYVGPLVHPWSLPRNF